MMFVVDQRSVRVMEFSNVENAYVKTVLKENAVIVI